MNDIQLVEELNAKAGSLPSKFFEGLPIYSDEKWLATQVFPACRGLNISSPLDWVLLGEEDIDYVRFVDEDGENESWGWVVYTHKDESYFTLSPDQKWNKSMRTIVQEVRYKM